MNDFLTLTKMSTKDDPTTFSTKSIKRQKISHQSPKPEIFKCNYIKPKNNKRCGLQVRKGQTYCFAHLNLINGTSKDSKVSDIEAEITRVDKNGNIIKRVKCTVDPSHTVWEDNLSKHIKNCNAVKEKKELEEKEETCTWFRTDYNVKDTLENLDIVQKSPDLDYEKWKQLIREWVSKHDLQFPEDLPLNNVEFKEGLEERFAELSNQKHILQQSSLIGQLVDHGIVSDSVNPGVVIEFGCGRAEFTRYFNKAMNKFLKTDSAKYLLIDRENPRLKFDKKIVTDSEEDGKKNVKVERLKVDIKDLKLIESLKELREKEDKILNFIGISKHLCGVATDLTLRCITNALRDSENEKYDFKFGGCLVAMCCRHCCKQNWLLPESKKYLKEKFDIDENNFVYFRKMFAWATNGVPPGMSKTDVGDHFSGLTYQEREKVGLKMRRILDESRKYAMIKRGFKAEIVRYVERNVSLENNCIIIKNSK